ncbi:TPA: hypothetical protein ACH3X2_000609 [Trebouxia sp. C0005]
MAVLRHLLVPACTLPNKQLIFLSSCTEANILFWLQTSPSASKMRLFAACFMVVVLQLGHAFAQATSAGTHSPAPAPAHAPAPAPAPGPSAYGCYTALNVLEASSQYTTLLSLLDSTDLTSYFDNLNHFITVFAPTNAGIQSTLNGFGTTLAKFAKSTAVTAVLEYHLLPSPVLVTALQNGNSFNTMFTQNAQVQTISVNRTSTYITVEGFFSNANVTSTGTQACGSVVYSLDGLLIPDISLSFASAS